MDTGSNGENPVTVSIEHVGLVRRDRDGRETPILSYISFAARRGEITAIVGPSGLCIPIPNVFYRVH